MPPRRRRRPFPIYRVVRATVATGLVVVLVVVLAYCAAILLIDPNSYKSQIEAAVKQATGRTLALRGPLHLAFGLPPWLVAEDVTLSNPGGLSRQEMATLERAEARIAVLPLLAGNINLTDLTLVHPDVLLERDVNGRGNWLLSAPGPSLSVAPAAPVDQSGGQVAPPPVSQLAMGQPIRSRVAVQSIHIEQGRVGWRPQPGAAVIELAIPRIDADASGPGGTMLLSGTVASADRSLRLSGEIGSLDRLFDRSAQVPWPVQVALRDPGAQLSVGGSIAQPLRGRGLALTLDATVTDFAGLVPFLPPDVPAPHDATVSMHWGDGKPESDASLMGITLHLDAMKLSSLLPDLEISHADIAAPGLDRPVHADIEGTSPGIGTLRLVVNAASLGAILPGAHPADPVPIDVTLDAGRALISAKGTVADPTALTGLDGDVFVRLPDVAAFGALVGRKLPQLSQVAFEGHVFGDLIPAGGIGLRKATLTLPEAELTGDADIRFGLRPYLHASVASQRIDLDSLLADLGGAWGTPEQTAAAASPPRLPEPAAAPPAEPSRWVIPDSPINLAALDRMDAEVEFRFDQLQVGGAAYTQISGLVQMRDGKLAIDPFGGVMAGGAAEGRFSVDSRAPDMPVLLYLRAPSVQLANLAPLLGDHMQATGTLGIDADLHGAGHTLHAIAGSLDGHLGIGSVDSELDNRLLLGLLKLARLPEVPLSAAGTTKLRCLAVRLEATKGVATVGALVVDLQRLAVVGGGTLDFGQEQLALQLRPMIRLGGAAGGVVLPVKVGGSFLDPKVASDAGKGGPPITGAGVADPCVPALAIAYGPGPVKPKPVEPVAPVVAAKPEAGGAPSAMDVLKELIK